MTLSSALVDALITISGHAPPTSSCDADMIAVAIEEGVVAARDRLAELTEKVDELEGQVSDFTDATAEADDKLAGLKAEARLEAAEKEKLGEALALANEKLAALSKSADPVDVQVAERDQRIEKLFALCGELRRFAEDVLDAADRRDIGKAARQAFKRRLQGIAC